MKTILIAAVSESFGSREAVSVVCVRKNGGCVCKARIVASVCMMGRQTDDTD